jgi:hypothetical protein
MTDAEKLRNMDCPGGRADKVERGGRGTTWILETIWESINGCGLAGAPRHETQAQRWVTLEPVPVLAAVEDCLRSMPSWMVGRNKWGLWDPKCLVPRGLGSWAGWLAGWPMPAGAGSQIQSRLVLGSPYLPRSVPDGGRAVQYNTYRKRLGIRYQPSRSSSSSSI